MSAVESLSMAGIFVFISIGLLCLLGFLGQRFSQAGEKGIRGFGKHLIVFPNHISRSFQARGKGPKAKGSPLGMDEFIQA